ESDPGVARLHDQLLDPLFPFGGRQIRAGPTHSIPADEILPCSIRGLRDDRAELFESGVLAGSPVERAQIRGIEKASRDLVLASARSEEKDLLRTKSRFEFSVE